MDISTVLLLGLLGSIALPFAATATGRFGGWIAALLPASLFVYFLGLTGQVGVAPIVDVVPWVPSLGIDLTFRLDGFSLLFALLITGIGALVMLYASSYMERKPAFSGAFLLYIFLFMRAMLAR